VASGPTKLVMHHTSTWEARYESSAAIMMLWLYFSLFLGVDDV
jgi:hypothetical protein